MLESGKRFLNSGSFIGLAKDIHAIVTHHEIKDDDDDQLYYTNIYLDEEMRTKHQIKLDHKSKIFQNLNGATTEVELSFQEVYPKLLNTMYDTEPLVMVAIFIEKPTPFIEEFFDKIANLDYDKDKI